MKPYNFKLVAVGVAVIIFILIASEMASATFSIYPRSICHHTPANTVTLTFQNSQSYNGHLGQPHSGSTYDTNGPCVTPTNTPKPTKRPEPTISPTSTPTASPSAIPTPIIVDEDPEPTDTPSATPAPRSEPQGVRSPNGSAQTCGTGAITVKPINAHLIRHSTWAEIKYVPTGGDEVNIYYKEVKDKDWKHAVRDEKNDGYVVIKNLDPIGYTFGLQQKNSCGGGDILIAVDPPVTKPMIFLFK